MVLPKYGPGVLSPDMPPVRITYAGIPGWSQLTIMRIAILEEGSGPGENGLEAEGTEGTAEDIVWETLRFFEKLAELFISLHM